MTTRCHECGASLARSSCEDLFDRLLALDHERVQPFGALHAVSVACHLLQHPSRSPARHRPQQLQIVAAFVQDGVPGMRQAVAAIRSAPSHRVRSRPAGALLNEQAAPTSFAATIHDVAVDGTFPADGYEQRLEEWASAVRAAYRTAQSHSR